MGTFSGKISASIGEIVDHVNKKKKNYDDDDDMEFVKSRFGRFLVWRTDGTYEPIGHLYS